MYFLTSKNNSFWFLQKLFKFSKTQYPRYFKVYLFNSRKMSNCRYNAHMKFHKIKLGFLKI